MGEPETQRREFFDALARMAQQAKDQRRAELERLAKQGGLSEDQKTELRALLAARAQVTPAA